MSDRDVRTDVVQCAQEMDRSGLVVGTAGNVSGRQSDGTICLTPSSTPYPDITAEGLAVVDLAGAHVEGSGKPSTEKAMHLACYNAFPEVGGVVHCHPVHGSMFAVARKPIPACIEEVIVYVGGDIPVADYATTGTQELADEVVRHLGDRGAVLMANHGLLCVGKSPADALHTALVVEHTAKIVWGAEQLGGVVPLPDEINESFANIYGLIRGMWSAEQEETE
jgi:L-fuculose-phosphate aldolase